MTTNKSRIGTSAPLLDDEVEIIAAEMPWSRPARLGEVGRVDGLDELEVLVDFGGGDAQHYRRQNLRVIRERVG